MHTPAKLVQVFRSPQLSAGRDARLFQVVELPAFISDFPIFVVASHIVIVRAVELIQRQAGLGCRAMHAEHNVVESFCPMCLDCEGLRWKLKEP